MTDVDEHGRPHPPPNAGEVETLLGFLEHHRATLAWKCGGVEPEGLRRTVGASTMTLGGLLKHMAFVEDYWFSFVLHENDPSPPWDGVDWEADRDWDWHSAADDTPKQLFDLWEESVARSRRLLAHAIERRGVDGQAIRQTEEGEPASVRWILVHMIEEYARHNGHADLLREVVDGQTGE
jgi:uncharacterized damage-inducible protein DinB